MSLGKILFITWVLTCFIFGQTTIVKPFLWEVSKSTQTFYLFGTIHLADPVLQNLPRELKTAIDKSDEVRTELTLDADFPLKSWQLMLRKDHKNLKQILPTALFNRVEKYMYQVNTKFSINPLIASPFQKLKVWALSTLLSGLKNQILYTNMDDIDTIIYLYAQREHKGIEGIETIEEQMAAMDSFTLQEQIKGLEATLDYLEEHPSFLEEMKKYYFKGEEAEIYAFIEKTMSMEDNQEIEKNFMQILLYDRNQRMTERILTLLHTHPSKDYLFAFGVMHFLGKKSILKKLEALGYTIKRIK